MGWLRKLSRPAATSSALHVVYAVSTWDSQSMESLWNLRVCFRKYQLLLRFLISWCINFANVRERASQWSLKDHLQWSLEGGQFSVKDRKTLESFVKAIDNLIKDISKTIQGYLPGDDCQLSVEWDSQKDRRDLMSRIHDSVSVAHLPGLTLSLKRTFTDTINDTTQNFRNALKGIETLLETKTGKGVQITGHTGDLLDIVGWSLDTKISIATLECRREILQAVVGNEAGFEKHPRNPVNEADWLPGGCFRGVIKLILYFEQLSGQIVVVHGTAFLLDEYTVATTGHCVYDWRFDQLCAIQAFVAYATPNEQSRRGTHVAVHWGWFKAFSPAHDLACIRLDNSFDDTHPMNICEKPTRDSGKIQVPGFKNQRNEPMLSSSCDVSWPLFKQDLLLSHKASTQKGNSGCPVITENGVVALHRASKYILHPNKPSEKSNEAVLLNQGSNNLYNISDCLKSFATSEITCSETGKYGSVCRHAKLQNGEKTKDIHLCFGKSNPLEGKTDPTSGRAT